ncbi:MAG: hypothetical protein ACOC44_14080 [Promethearchaeia archaeon]
MSKDQKEIRIKLSGLLLERFNWIKSSLGIRQETEIFRFLVHHYYHENFSDAELESAKKKTARKGRGLIDQVMDKYRDGMKKVE